LGRIYLPDSSYREMTEWALPVPRLQAYTKLVQSLGESAHGQQIKRFLRGGFWRNFKVKYPETQEMYARMMQVSQRLAEAGKPSDRSLRSAYQDLYRAQCNCTII